MKCRNLIALLLLIFPPLLYSYSSIFGNDKVIWDKNTYAAFTSLEYYEGYFYCTFREAQKHWDNTGKDCGIIRLLRSKECEKWTLYHTYSIDGHDLRDPQLCITPDNRLMLTAEDVVYKSKEVKSRSTVYSFKKGKKKMSELHKLTFSPNQQWNWLWQPSLVNDTLCGFLYCPYFAFVKSTNNTDFMVGEKNASLNTPTEASVAYYNDNYFAVVRTEGNAYLGQSTTGEKWDWFELNEPIGCPKLFVTKNQLYCAGRSYVGGHKTAIYKIDINTRRVDLVRVISKSKDSAYPGVVVHDDIVYVSYYAADKNEATIHICKLNL